MYAREHGDEDSSTPLAPFSREAAMKSQFVWMLWASIAASASAPPWQRHIQSGKGESFDTPEPHPLGYFIDDPFLRDDGGDFCSDCAPPGRASVHLERKFKIEVTQVATLQGFAIYDPFYHSMTT
jgi:hypothetical protein